jgi:hypothetical protein
VSDNQAKPQPSLKERDDCSIKLSPSEDGDVQSKHPAGLAEPTDSKVEPEPTPADHDTGDGLKKNATALSTRSAGDGHHAKALGSKSHYTGMLRHKIIVAVSVLASLSFLALNSVNLQSLSYRSASIDKSLHITYEPEKPQLPAGFAYSDQWWGWNTSPSPDTYIIDEDTWGDDHKGFADAHGHIIIKPQFNDLQPFSEGLAGAAVGGPKNSKWGYINRAGQFVIQPEYQRVTEFSDGAALAYSQHKSAVIDKTGKVLAESPGEYSIQPVAGGLFIVPTHKNQCGIMDRKGNWVIEPKYQEIHSLGGAEFLSQNGIGPSTAIDDRFMKRKDIYFTFFQNGLWGLLDGTGRVLIPAKFQPILSYHNGYATVMSNDKVGMIDTSGKFIIQPRYDFITEYDKLIAVRDGGKWQFIDDHGKFLSIPAPQAIICGRSGKWLEDGLGAVIYNGRCGYINAEGKLAIEPRFDFVSSFRNGYAAVFENSAWRYIDKNGKFALPVSVLWPAPLGDGISSVSTVGPLHSIMSLSQQNNFTHDGYEERRDLFIRGYAPSIW